MKGRIIKGIAGFYYVVAESGIYECKARGIFRKNGMKPLVGDEVEIEVTHEADKEASIREILPRKNELIRPAVANVDQAMILFALRSPDPDGMLLDRFLIMMEMQGVPVFICFNKKDLSDGEEIDRWRKIYESCGYRVVFCSAGSGDGTDEVAELLRGKVTVVAGPSGVGKSTLTNVLSRENVMETGEISRKLRRGKNTTRHSELIQIERHTFLCDTPGFTSLYLPEMQAENLENYFPEFAPWKTKCRFVGCAHISEPDCAVKEALARGDIARERYDHYVRIYQELKDQEKRRY